jgi:SNF2 family DNA or RNA helicase
MLTPTYQPKLPRWTHQNQAMRVMSGHDAFALLMEMRTGKTKVILDEFGQDEAQGLIENLLIVAPAGVYRTWEVDAAKHLSDDLRRRVKIGRWESDASPEAKRQLTDSMKRKGPKILLMNVEALSTVDAAKMLCGLFLTQGPTTMVIDESTTIKNPSAKRTKFCLRAGRVAKKRRILSGMPTPQSPLDVYSQFDFLDPKIIGYSSYYQFRNRYAMIVPKPFGPGGRMIDTITGYQNLEELRAKLQPHNYRVKLADCYDLPEKMYLRRDVELTQEQKIAYQEMQAFATTVLENTERVTATIVLTQLLRLHQILAGHTRSDNGVLIDIPENKTREVLAILQEHSGKAIIWAAYDADIRKIAEKITGVYGPGSVARFWGGNADTREAEEKAFKTDPKCRFMVATASAGGRGRTWDVADLMIYYSNTFSLEHRMQSEERAQMVGKVDRVAYFDLITLNTVEEKIVRALRDKMNLSDAITGDNYREWITP